LEATTEKVWHQLPPVILPSPVFAVTAGRDGIWAGGAGGVAWFPTTGNGSQTSETWQSRISGLPLSSVTTLTYIDSDNLLLAGGVEGIARSRDGGRSWQLANLEDGVAAVIAFAVSPHFAEDQTAIAATLANGVLRTDDGGRTWKNVAFGLESFEVTALLWDSGSSILAATSDGLYRSPNTGRAWRRMHEEEGLGIDAMAYLPDGTILATLEEGGLLRSEDGGKSWFTDDNALQDTHTISLLVTPDKALLLGTVEQGLLRSTDDGISWQPVYNNIVLTLAAGNSAVYAGTTSGVSVSYDDGLTWHELPYPPVHDLRHLFIFDGRPLLTGSYTGITRYTPDGTWQVLQNVEQPLTGTAIAPDGSLWLSSPEGLVRSTDGGQTQQSVIQGQAGQVAHMTFREEGTGWRGWAGSADGTRLLRSDDSGMTWRPLRAPFGILPLAALQATADKLFAATYDPRQYRITIWFSHDDGKTWERGAEAETKWPIVATCKRPALVTTGDVMLLQRTSGQWSKITVGSDSGAIRRVVSAQYNGKTVLLVLTTTGIQRTEDEGATWQHDDTGLPLEQIIDIAATDTTLYILLAGGHVWQREL